MSEQITMTREQLDALLAAVAQEAALAALEPQRRRERERAALPENRERSLERGREYRALPENRERARKRSGEHYALPENRERARKRAALPENRERANRLRRERRAAAKAASQAAPE